MSKNIVKPSDNQLSLPNFTSEPQTPFDSIRHGDEKTGYWLARELMPLLDYSKWQNFKRAIADAIKSCANSGHVVGDHFGLLTSVTQSGKGRDQENEDFRLSRYACYLIAMNGDPSKRAIADAQGYFLQKTRQAELDEKDANRKRLNKHNQDITAYQLHGKAADWAEARVESKVSQKELNAALYATHEAHAPDYGAVGAMQNAELIGMTKREIVAYLGLLPKDEPKYRDMLSKYALQAIDLMDTAMRRQMVQCGRALTTDEQLDIARDKARQAARIMREAASMAGVDFVSGAPLDTEGNPLLTRHVRLLK